MKIKSYPKVNLSLLIGKKNNKSGLHKIKSIFCLIDSIYDEIEISLNDKDNVSYEGINGNQLVLKDCIIKKTLSILRKKNLISNNVFFNIKVKKNIPLFSGVGSGSSNAGTIIRYLLNNSLIKWNKKLKKAILEIGSDVMFFVKNYKCAIVFGYGEKVLKFRNNNKLNINLFFNDVKCSTKNIFEKFDLTKNKKVPFLKQLLYFQNNKYNLLVNELENICIQMYPELQNKMNEISLLTNKKVFLSGSGSTLFTVSKG